MEKEHEWIADEKDNFGRTGTPYDFKGQNIAECKATLRNLTERFQGMKKKINPKVMNMIDSVEKKEVSLKNMMKTVIRDKKKIEETIVTLDEYKKRALQETWTKVNGDFGQIFAELLPGSFAKLDPPEGKTINEGLEVKVSLGSYPSPAPKPGNTPWRQHCQVEHLTTRTSLTSTHNRKSVEAEPDRALGRPAVPHRHLAHHGPAAVQAGAHVHLGRSRRGARSLAHAEHRPTDQEPLPRQPVHRR